MDPAGKKYAIVKGFEYWSAEEHRFSAGALKEKSFNTRFWAHVYKATHLIPGKVIRFQHFIDWFWEPKRRREFLNETNQK